MTGPVLRRGHACARPAFAGCSSEKSASSHWLNFSPLGKLWNNGRHMFTGKLGIATLVMASSNKQHWAVVSECCNEQKELPHAWPSPSFPLQSARSYVMVHS